MREIDIVVEFYIRSTCSLHNIQKCLQNAVTNVLGEGGFDTDDKPIMNCMQMLRGAYNIQDWHNNNKLVKLCEYFTNNNNNVLKKIQKARRTNRDLVVISQCVCVFLH